METDKDLDSSMDVSWPMVQREQAFRQIRDAVSASGDRGDATGVVLTGDAGVGKTTLARYAARTLTDANVRWVAGTESARNVPLGAFGHLIGQAALRDPVTFLTEARTSLVGAGSAVIGVDDAHLLDQLSATLLLQLAIDRSAHIIATVRSGERVPDAITSLWKDGHLNRIELRPFTRAQSIDLVESVLDGKLEGLSADLLWKASGGNALYLRHLVEAALESGSLRRVQGVWQLRGQAGVTSELASLLGDRVTALPAEIQRALRLLSLCEPMDIGVLSTLAGDEAVEEAERRELVRVVEDGAQLNARFTHPMFGEVVRRSLGVAGARRLRGEIVTAMRASGHNTKADTVRLAELALGSDQSVDVDLLGDAARIATELADVTLGERFARAAVERGGGISAADLLARSLLWQARPTEVEAALADFSVDDLDADGLLRWGATRICNFYFALGDAASGDEVLALLQDRITAPELMAVVQAIVSACAHHKNDLDEAVRIGTEVLSQPRVPTWAVGWATVGSGRSLALMGRGASVDEIADRLRAVGSHIDGLLRYPAAFGEVQALAFTGRFAKARQRATEYLDFSSSGQSLAWGLANTMGGFVDVATGSFGPAVERLEPAVAALLPESAATWLYPARISLVHAYSVVGRADEARQILADAWRRFGAHLAVFEPQMRVAEAWIAATEDGASRAIELAHVAAKCATECHQYAIEAEALHAAARFGDGSVHERLAELAASVDGDLVPLYARHALALDDQDAEALEDCGRDFEALGALLSATDALAQAAGRHEADGNRSRAAAAGTAAYRIAALCGDVTTPALRAIPDPSPLTARESEIARLVASGLANSEIAQRLFLSVRTVEGHIYRACAKLDVTDRDQLAAIVGQTTNGLL